MAGGPHAARMEGGHTRMRQRLERAAAGMHEAAELSPQRARLILQQRARELARPPQQAQLSQDSFDVVVFRLANERYALDCRFAREIVRLRRFTIVPGAPRYFLGVTNLRGGILPIVNLHGFFALPEDGLAELSHLLVVGRRGPEFGVLVDAVESIDSVSLGDLSAVTEIADKIEHRFVRGVTREAVIVLDGPALLADTRLIVGEKPATAA